MAKFYNVTSIQAEAEHLVLTVDGAHLTASPGKRVRRDWRLPSPENVRVIEVAPSGLWAALASGETKIWRLRPLLAVAERVVVEERELA